VGAKVHKTFHRGRIGYLPAFVKSVERTDLNQTFQGTFLYLSQVHTAAKIAQAGKRAAFLPRLDNRQQRTLTDILDSDEAKPDASLTVRLSLDVKIEFAEIDIGRQHRNTNAAAFSEERRDFGDFAMMY